MTYVRQNSYSRAGMFWKVLHTKLVFFWLLFKIQLTNTLSDGGHFHINISILICVIYAINLQNINSKKKKKKNKCIILNFLCITAIDSQITVTSKINILVKKSPCREFLLLPLLTKESCNIKKDFDSNIIKF